MPRLRRAITASVGKTATIDVGYPQPAEQEGTRRQDAFDCAGAFFSDDLLADESPEVDDDSDDELEEDSEDELAEESPLAEELSFAGCADLFSERESLR